MSNTDEHAGDMSGANEPTTDQTAAGAPAATRAVTFSASLGAMFLMATSAIGPGFITQTTNFTVDLGAAFAFAILVSILVDIAIQLNVWRVLGVSGKRANELGNEVLPGLGWVMAAFVFVGGLIFNIGNIGGTGLGLNAMLGLSPLIGGGVSALIAIFIFLSKRGGMALDRIVVGLGAIMILLMIYVAIVSSPPLGEALQNTVMPDEVDFLVITTLIGGTVGGYITFAGAHRMIDSGQTGVENVGTITKVSISGIIVTGVMRVLLFLAILGVVASGVTLAGNNMAADAFRHAAGDIGVRFFGVVLWAAGLTSVVGASYTSLTFVTPQSMKKSTFNWLVVGFIIVCATIYLVVNKAPQKLLIFAGAFNGLILPIGFAVVLWVAWRRRDLMQNYKYPAWLLVLGVITWLLTLYLSWSSLSKLPEIWA